jgi:predicted membrane chloride channel (bestrophin family)
MDVELCGGGKEPQWLRPSESAAIQKAEAVHTPRDNKGRPSLIAALLSHKVYYMYHRGWMNAAVLKKCDKCINDFVGAWMACEKIVGVPMVFPYTQMLSVFMVLFVYTFPLPLAHIFFNEEAEFNGFFITPFICARECQSQFQCR